MAWSRVSLSTSRGLPVLLEFVVGGIHSLVPDSYSDRDPRKAGGTLIARMEKEWKFGAIL